MFLYFYADGGKMSEAEVRFAVIDCVVKGICRLTVAAEESISKSEKAVKKRSSMGQASTSQMPTQQSTVKM